MRTVGVDLAADPAGTAVAVLEWSAAGAWLRDLIRLADDEAVVAAVRSADKAGIDCPLGWPDAFVTFVGAHRSGPLPADDTDRGKAWRRGLAWRVTDEVVREATGILPLSVSADRIGHIAMRCAALQSLIAGPAGAVDRSGAGRLVEVYPAASLKIWGLPWRGYKGTAGADLRAEIVDRLLAATPWLDLGDHADRCRRSDHALDAVLAACSARAAACGRTVTPHPSHLAAARTEGWIALPDIPLADLLSPPHIPAS